MHRFQCPPGWARLRESAITFVTLGIGDGSVAALRFEPLIYLFENGKYPVC